MAIAEHLTGEMADMMDNFNIVFTHIKNLKRKLDSTGCPECIRTLYGAGYKWIV
jgi:DNA-binding response OmpR family regulator